MAKRQSPKKHRLDSPYFAAAFAKVINAFKQVRGGSSEQDELLSEVTVDMLRRANNTLDTEGPEAALELILTFAKVPFLRVCLRNKLASSYRRSAREELVAAEPRAAAVAGGVARRAKPGEVTEARALELLAELSRDEADNQALLCAYEHADADASLEEVSHDYGYPSGSKADTEIRRARRRIKLSRQEVLDRLVAALAAKLALLSGRQALAAAGHAGLAAGWLVLALVPAAQFTGEGALAHVGLASVAELPAPELPTPAAEPGPVGLPPSSPEPAAAPRAGRAPAPLAPARLAPPSAAAGQTTAAPPAAAPLAAPAPARPALDFGRGRPFVERSAALAMAEASRAGDWHRVLALSEGGLESNDARLMAARAYAELGQHQNALQAVEASLAPGASIGPALREARVLQVVSLTALGERDLAEAAAAELPLLARLRAKQAGRRAARAAR